MNKPCPFCAGNELDLQVGTQDREGWPVNIVCTTCGAAGPWAYSMYDTEDELYRVIALKEWNNRN